MTVHAIVTTAVFGLAGVMIAPAASATTLNTSSAASETSEGTDGVEVDGRAVTAEDDSVSITLPGNVTDSEVDAASLPDGQFKGEGDPVLNTSVAGSLISTYATDEGTQTLISIPSASSPSEYRFPLDIPGDGQAVILPDGSVAIVGADGNPLGGFHTPWAYDANGKALPTSFRIDGDTLIQTVDLSGATAFPVIADPDRGTAWWGVWFRYTKAETKKLAVALQQGNAAMVKDVFTTACGLAPGWTAVACGLFIQAKWYLTMQPAIDANSRGQCFVLNIPTIATGLTINGTIVNCTR
jgi:hypothetical protein